MLYNEGHGYFRKNYCENVSQKYLILPTPYLKCVAGGVSLHCFGNSVYGAVGQYHVIRSTQFYFRSNAICSE